jgi:transposase
MKARRTFSVQDKIAVLRLHLLEKRPVSDVCNRYMLNPTVLYRWKTQLFQRGTIAFAEKRRDKAARSLDSPFKELAKWTKEQAVHAWMLKLMQAKVHQADFRVSPSGESEASCLSELLKSAVDGPLRRRNRAICVLSSLKGIPLLMISRFLCKPRSTIYNWIRTFHTCGLEGLLNPSRKELKKHEDVTYMDGVFATIHAPPRSHGINRTT